MRVGKTIRFDWRTIRKTYKATCSGCGKKYARVASRGFNELATKEDIRRYQDELDEEVRRLTHVAIVCTRCLASRSSVGGGEPAVWLWDAEHKNVSLELKNLEIQLTEINAANIKIRTSIERHNGRVFRHKDNWYVQYDLGWYDDELLVHGLRISKVRPWETVNDGDIHVGIDEVEYYDEMFVDRKPK